MQFDVHTHKFDKSYHAIWNLGLKNHFTSLPEQHYFSIGIHPWEAENFTSEVLKRITEIAQHKNCIALGEIGLDRANGPNLDIQKDVFKKQALLAEKLNLPIILHCVKAWNEVKVIKQEIQPRVPWVFHGFSKSGLIQSVLESGCFISIGSSLLSNLSLQERFNEIPDNRLLFETDNSGLSIDLIYQKAAQLKGIGIDDLETIVEKNIRTIFAQWIIG